MPIQTLDGQWPRERILRAIQALYKKDIFPSYQYVRTHEPDLFEAAGFRFGPWEFALAAACVIRPPMEGEDEYFDHELCVWAHDSLTQPIHRGGL